MSLDNVAIVREAIKARNRDLDEWLAFFHPAVQSSDRLTAAGMTTESEGLGELRRDAEQWTEIFDEWKVEIVELQDSMNWSSPRSGSTVTAERAERRWRP